MFIYLEQEAINATTIFELQNKIVTIQHTARFQIATLQIT